MGKTDVEMFKEKFADIVKDGVEKAYLAMKDKYRWQIMCDGENPMEEIPGVDSEGFVAYTMGGFSRSMFVHSEEEGVMHTSRLNAIAFSVWEDVVANNRADGVEEADIDDMLLSKVYVGMWVYPKKVNGMCATVDKGDDQYGFGFEASVMVAGDEPCSEPTPHLEEKIGWTKGFVTRDELSVLVKEAILATERWGVAKWTVPVPGDGDGSMDVFAVHRFGCAVGVLDGTLLGVTMNADGSLDLGSGLFEVTAPESQLFLDRANRLLDTGFTLADFAGR